MMAPTQKGQGFPSKSVDKPICFPEFMRRVTLGVLFMLPRLRLSLAIGVGRSVPVDPSAFLKGSNGICSTNLRPEGVITSFHCIPRGVDPFQVGHLFSKNNCGLASFDKFDSDRQKVSFVSGSKFCTCDTDWLARKAGCPNRSACRPSCKLQGEGPSTDAREEVALGVSVDVAWLNIGYAPCVYVALWYQPLIDQFLQPCCRWLVPLVVVVHAFLSFRVPVMLRRSLLRACSIVATHLAVSTLLMGFLP